MLKSVYASLAAALVGALLSFGALAQSEPIRVGFLTVRTGPLAAGGKQMEEGILLFLKERNYTLAGRKIELTIADTGGNPAGTKNKTQDLVERNKVHVIIGPLAAFQRTFEESGGKIVQKLWPPLNVPDYGSYIAQIKGNVDAVYAGFAGANGFRFLKQYNEYGMKAKIPVLGSATTVDEGILKNMGEEAVGVISTAWYSATIDTPDNRKFVAAVNKEYNADPGYYTTGAYSSGLMLEQALRAVSGKIEDKDAFMKALHAVHVTNDPRGEIKLDEYGNPVQNIYIRKVERKGAKLVNTVLKVYPNVSQFWSYDPKQFLASPVYTRDHPPAKNLE